MERGWREGGASRLEHNGCPRSAFPDDELMQQKLLSHGGPITERHSSRMCYFMSTGECNSGWLSPLGSVSSP